MPNIASIGWAYVSGSTVANISYNASTFDRETIIPEGYYCLLYGPVYVNEGVDFKIESEAIVKIDDFSDV